MINRLLGLFLLVSSSSLVVFERAQADDLISRDFCNSLGRIINSDDPRQIGKELCEDSELIVGDGKVQIGCFQGGRSRWLSTGRYDIDELCAYQRTVEGDCWFVIKAACRRSSEKITLKSPRSSTVLTTPELEWEAVEEASYYEIFIESDGGESNRIKSETPNANLSSYSPWKQGSLYRIKILAATKGRILSEGKFTIRIPSGQEMHEIDEAIEAIETSNYPTLDKVRLADSVYYSAGLIKQSIEYLESAAISSKSVELEIARILAYRYSEIGDPKNAGENFQIMADNSPEGSEDKEFAEEMLERIVHYQARANFQ